MALGTCLADLLARKLISQQRHDKLKPEYDGLVAQYAPRYGQAAAESMATERVMKLALEDADHSKRSKLLQAKAQGTIYHQAKHVYGGGKFADGPITRLGLLAHLTKDQRYGGIMNVELQSRVLLNEAHRLNWTLLNHFRHDLLGEVRHKADLLDLARALHGEDVSDLNLKEMAQAARETNRWQVSRFNAAGGRIPLLDDWGVPHTHDAYRVGALSAEQWIDAVVNDFGLDRNRMIDFDTLEPMSDAKLHDTLRQVYDSITTKGAKDMKPGQAGSRAWSNRWAEHRVLHFKDAEAWYRYNDRFGTGTVLDALNNHWSRMAHATGAMDVLGPNPPATIRWMQDLLEQEANTKGTIKDRRGIERGRFDIEKQWDELTGASRRAVRPTVALFFSTVRHFESASRLGFAVISALSDHATRFTANTMSGLPITAEMGRYFKMLNPLDPATREWARRNLIVSQELAGRMGGLGRLHIDDNFAGPLAPQGRDLHSFIQSAHEITRRMSDGAMRLTGLTGHTIASREAGAYQFVANLSLHSRDGWKALDGDFRGLLERHGFGPADWEQLRQTQQTDWRGKGWLLPHTIPDQALRERVMRALMMEIDLGTPTSGARQAAQMRAGRPGTFLGEGIAGAVQFKMFPVVVVAEHMQRMMAVPNLSGRAKYAAAFFGSTMIMGALAQQLYEIAHGRDPLPMDDWTFWGKAAARSGGAGVYGDAIRMSQNEFGQSLSDLTAGPQLTTAQNLAAEPWAIGSAAVAAAKGDPVAEHKAREQWAKANRNLLRREVPVLNTWYTNAAYERLLVDTLFEMSAGDPAAVQKSYGATEQYAKDQGNSYWAPPGKGIAGMRAPDLSKALGSADSSETATPDVLPN